VNLFTAEPVTIYENIINGERIRLLAVPGTPPAVYAQWSEDGKTWVTFGRHDFTQPQRN
jgi:hypothetical protein